jgi:hypothetical protein
MPFTIRTRMLKIIGFTEGCSGFGLDLRFGGRISERLSVRLTKPQQGRMKLAAWNGLVNLFWTCKACTRTAALKKCRNRGGTIFYSR